MTPQTTPLHQADGIQILQQTGREGGQEIAVQHPLGRLRIALQGAQLLEWTPSDDEPVIWTSPVGRSVPGKSVRGGAPVCWPWFGVREGLPAHGYVRGLPWTLTDWSATEDAVCLTLCITADETAGQPGAIAADCRLEVTMTDRLRLALVSISRSAVDLPISQALHTYFQVSDIGLIRVEGLEGAPYLDKLDQSVEKVDGRPLEISGEVDRVYFNSTQPVELIDSQIGRTLVISKSNSESWVVWNPWVEKGDKLGDMGPEGYRKMLCIETCQAGPDERVLPAGGELRLETTYTVYGVGI